MEKAALDVKGAWPFAGSGSRLFPRGSIMHFEAVFEPR